MIHPTAVIGPDVNIGKNVYIGPYCVIGMPAEHKGHWPRTGGVTIGDNTIITGMVTIDAGTERTTTIGEGCFIMKHSHIGHDAILEDQVTVACGAKVGGHATIMTTANIGLNAVIHQYQVIGSYCMIGMGAVITKRLYCMPFNSYGGNPARLIGPNRKWDDIDPTIRMMEADRYNIMINLIEW